MLLLKFCKQYIIAKYNFHQNSYADVKDTRPAISSCFQVTRPTKAHCFSAKATWAYQSYAYWSMKNTVKINSVDLINADSLHYIATSGQLHWFNRYGPTLFKVKPNGWDNQWKGDKDYLLWLDSCLAEYARVLKPAGSITCFAVIVWLQTLRSQFMKITWKILFSYAMSSCTVRQFTV